ncbi:uncharacterized protein A4U43_C05F15990 [Asparagus officinalis]|uniref:Protein MIZU-KUSSEI 1 n=1 Tax=Asparagus officinalis TaxID=4686 RepID=A0A5P1EUG0_ASPOF|nr:protein MIZU-KUSSEI 1-like [Asparagus officinalis]ONK68787.1 uncharacterized protein A4U43_C05F15990 [Asparagus officinalis]
MRMVDLGNQRGPLCIIDPSHLPSSDSSDSDSSTVTTTTSTVTGTFFGYRKGRVSFCIQSHSSSVPLLLLEFSIPTSYLAKEMQYGLLRIALECNRVGSRSRSGQLFNIPVWTMYCNGRRVGYALKRQMSEGDVALLLKTMKSTSVGAGVLPGLVKPESGDMMYLRARFERVIGSVDSESFHMMNPVGSTGQELSIFLLRS